MGQRDDAPFGVLAGQRLFSRGDAATAQVADREAAQDGGRGVTHHGRQPAGEDRQVDRGDAR
jgi:hypothetical protein